MRRRATVAGFRVLIGAMAAAALGFCAAAAQALDLSETPLFQDRVARGQLPKVADRVPKAALVVDLAARGRQTGRQGGEIVSLVSRARDIRYLSANSYARLVGYTEKLELVPDLLAGFDNDRDTVFTFRLREGHRWSDGQPFTAEDFRYWWEDVANDKTLNPAGLPDFLMVEGKPPRFEVIDARTVRLAWEKPNPRFLPTLAQPRDPFLYRPAHYLKQFHARYADKAALEEAARKQKMKSWASLHNRMDDMFENSNPDLPTLQPWRVITPAPATRFVFERNAYYHRVDTAGQQLPYVDRIVFDVAAAGLMAAKANSGDADLLVRGLAMSDIPILKEGERAHKYRTLAWPYARGSELALFPNLNTADPVWRALNRDLRYRRALSLAIDRRMLNNALLFGLGREGNDTISEESPLFQPEFRTLNAGFDPTEASRLLDEVGLTKRNSSGTRLLPDGRELEIIVETDGESAMVVDGLTLIAEFWRDVGVKLFVKPQDRSVLRNRAYSGQTVMVGAQGLDLAVPTGVMSPAELAPLRQDNYAWPKWGQFSETRGQMGEAIDSPEAKRMTELYQKWLSLSEEDEQAKVWREMLRIRAENVWSIGTVAGALQPVVAKVGLKNIPERAIYSWEPTSMLGVYRMDEFFWDRPAGRESWLRPRAGLADVGLARFGSATIAGAEEARP